MRVIVMELLDDLLVPTRIEIYGSYFPVEFGAVETAIELTFGPANVHLL